MTKPSSEKLNELADKWLKGTISHEERLLLDQWYNTEAEDPLQLDVPDASEAEFSNRLLTNIHTRNNFEGKTTRKRWFIPAAAAAILICLSVAFYFYQSDDQSTYLQAAKLISPGKNNAVLTLSDGRKINLNETTNGVIAAQHGLQVSKTADGRLVYELSPGKQEDTTSNDYHTIESPKGGEWQVKLPDGSIVFLNASSKLTYPTHFKMHERKVRMEGEAYFEVAPNKSKPFRVVSGEQTVEVLGTHFNITAYPAEMIRTTLIEGSVNVKAGGQSAILTPGKQAAFSNQKLQVFPSADLEEVLAWKNGYFKFDENLESIMRKIARWYDVEVQYETRPDPALTFSGKISRSRDLSGILKMLAFNGDIHFKVEGRRITVTK